MGIRKLWWLHYCCKFLTFMYKNENCFISIPSLIRLSSACDLCTPGVCVSVIFKMICVNLLAIKLFVEWFLLNVFRYV